MNLQTAVQSYSIPEAARQLIHAHQPLGLAGPTGAGKSTLAHYLTLRGDFAPVVSDTTRRPRPIGNDDEVNGVHYWFISEAEALEKLSHKKYVEAKLVHGDTLYGTSIAAYQHVVNNGRTAILDIDIQGMEEFMSVDPDFEAILLLPPSFEVWNQRIDGRGDMTAENKIRRFQSALKEYEVVFRNERFYPVMNTEVVETAEVIKSKRYKDPGYKQAALAVARALVEETRAYLATHPS
jgi:guanylate kinase